jgi:hypothetical protein
MFTPISSAGSLRLVNGYQYTRFVIACLRLLATQAIAIARIHEHAICGIKCSTLIRLLTVADNIVPTKEGPYFCEPEDHHGKTPAVADAPSGGGHATIAQHVLQKRLAKGTTGKVSADDQQNDSLYLSPVQFGTPPQTLNLDFDTGSSDLWVWSDKLPAAVKTKGRANGHKIFDSTKSTTFKPSSGSTWQISYGDGSSASGSVGTDIVQLGDIKVEGQAIELATKMAQSFQDGVGGK